MSSRRTRLYTLASAALASAVLFGCAADDHGTRTDLLDAGAEAETTPGDAVTPDSSPDTVADPDVLRDTGVDPDACERDSDCTAAICVEGRCVEAADGCVDGVISGDETDVDCGGSCPECGVAKRCQDGDDCISGVCMQESCVDPTCTDGVRNGFESDVDCGPGCEPCADGRVCQVDQDCASGDCEDGACISCADGVINGDEEEVDCGGERCETCAEPGSCETDDDCLHRLCESERCVAPSASWIAAGQRHACAVVQRGRVLCWGDDDQGQISELNPNRGEANTRFVTLAETGGHLEGALRVFAGPHHSCAATADKLFCWGTYRYGDRSGSLHAWEIQFAASVGGATSIAGVETMGLGDNHTCFRSGTRVHCWGSNASGQLGSESQTLSPAPFANGYADPLRQLTADDTVSAGDNHTCVGGPGGVQCWGHNSSGQAGKQGGEPVIAPHTLAGLVTTGLAVFGEASCAIRGSEVACWGARPYTTSAGASLADIPLSFSGWSNPSAIALGRRFLCATLAEGVSCVGRTESALGTQLDSPRMVAGLDGEVAQLVAGGDFACARMSTGEVRCWGANDKGQLGDGTETSRIDAAPWVP